MGVIGFMIAISTMDTAIRYVSLYDIRLSGATSLYFFSSFLMTQASVAYVVLMTWVSNSIPESSKRAVGIAFVNTLASLGNVAAS